MEVGKGANWFLNSVIFLGHVEIKGDGYKFSSSQFLDFPSFQSLLCCIVPHLWFPEKTAIPESKRLLKDSKM